MNRLLGPAELGFMFATKKTSANKVGLVMLFQYFKFYPPEIAGKK
jgi:hypothetical protein